MQNSYVLQGQVALDFQFLEERYELVKNTVIKDLDTYTSIVIHVFGALVNEFSQVGDFELEGVHQHLPQVFDRMRGQILLKKALRGFLQNELYPIIGRSLKGPRPRIRGIPWKRSPFSSP